MAKSTLKMAPFLDLDWEIIFSCFFPLPSEECHFWEVMQADDDYTKYTATQWFLRTFLTTEFGRQFVKKPISA